MRVDLALQHIKFAFSSFILFPYDFFHQFGILPVGFLNGLSQICLLYTSYPQSENKNTTIPRITRTTPVTRLSVFGVALFANTAAIPVSYTHLDVYKRQLLSIGNRSRKNWWMHGKNHGLFGRFHSCPVAGRSYARCYYIDVYKRQVHNRKISPPASAICVLKPFRCFRFESVQAILLSLIHI